MCIPFYSIPFLMVALMLLMMLFVLANVCTFLFECSLRDVSRHASHFSSSDRPHDQNTRARVCVCAQINVYECVCLFSFYFFHCPFHVFLILDQTIINPSYFILWNNSLDLLIHSIYKYSNTLSIIKFIHFCECYNFVRMSFAFKFE